MNEQNTALLFRPADITLTLVDPDTEESTLYKIRYDMNAFVELEKMYGSVAAVLDLILNGANNDDDTITYNGTELNPDEIIVGSTPLSALLASIKRNKVQHSDTLKILWAGLIHAYCKYDEYGEIIGYSLPKAKLAKCISFANLAEINIKVVTSILRDLYPAQEKNVEAPEQKAPEQVE